MIFKLLSDQKPFIYARIDDDGKCRLTCTEDHPEFKEWIALGNVPEPVPVPVVTSQQVNDERDHRIATRFIFNGKPFDFDFASKQRVTGAATLAKFAVLMGAQPGDLQWAGTGLDFSWIAGDNTLVTMDAQTCSAFGDAAAAHEQAHIFAARTLKDMETIPTDYTDDKYWP